MHVLCSCAAAQRWREAPAAAEAGEEAQEEVALTSGHLKADILLVSHALSQAVCDAAAQLRKEEEKRQQQQQKAKKPKKKGKLSTQLLRQHPIKHTPVKLPARGTLRQASV